MVSCTFTFGTPWILDQMRNRISFTATAFMPPSAYDTSQGFRCHYVKEPSPLPNSCLSTHVNEGQPERLSSLCDFHINDRLQNIFQLSGHRLLFVAFGIAHWHRSVNESWQGELCVDLHLWNSTFDNPLVQFYFRKNFTTPATPDSFADIPTAYPTTKTQ